MLRGAELFRELGWGEKVHVVGNRLTVEIGEESVQAVAVAHWQDDIQLHDLSSGEMSDRPCYAIGGDFADVACHYRLRPAYHGPGADKGYDREQQRTDFSIHNSSWGFAFEGEEIPPSV